MISSLSKALLSATLLAKVALAGPHEFCSSSLPYSCQNTTAISEADLCCFESPGGELLLVELWDTNPSTGPADSWTIHGLWPDYCDGTYGQFCDGSRNVTNVTSLLQSYNKTDLLDYMEQYWVNQGSSTGVSGSNEEFWEHEWDKHGTCFSTLTPSCYTSYFPQQEVVGFFEQVVSIFKTLPTYEYLKSEGIVPSYQRNYTNEEVMGALRKARGVNATIECEDDGTLYSVYYTFNVRGSVVGGGYEAVEPVGEGNGCPETGIRYLPKNGTVVTNGTVARRRM